MKELIKKLNEAAKLYYNYGTSPLTDKEYDALFQQLKEEERRTGIVYSNSPTQKVGAPVLDEQRKINIIDRPMLSLEKIYSQEAIDDFANGQTVIGMVKCDGLSVRIIYENGSLVSANTRGDGLIGQDISEHIKHFKNVPLTIPYDKRFVIDGEAVILDQDFKQLQGFANSRNAAAGALGLLDMKEVEARKLSFIAWDIIDGKNGLDYLTQLLSFAAKLGFQVCPHSLIASNEEIRDEAIKKGIPQDGVVWRYNDLAYGESLGRTSHHWNYACAYKFPDEEYETELLDIEWSMGRTGVLTPVAIYKDVEIDGAICNRANLHNLNIIIDLFGSAVLKGQKIWVYKANQIIPQISKVQPAEEILGVDPAYFFGNDEFEFINPPHTCPICGGETEVRTSDSGTQEVYCTNPQCPGKLVNKLDHFCGKKGLDIKGLSKATLEKLIDWGWVSSISDICMLGEVADLWANKPGFGPKSVTKLIDAIWKARETTLAQYLSAISIPLIGKTYAQKLADFFETYEEFRSAVADGFVFESIDGIGPEKADAIWSFDYTEADNLVEKGIITFKVKESALENSGNSLEGKIFCVTGKVKHWKNRDELSAAIVAKGGKVTSSVSSKTNYLVNNDINSTSSKNLKAKELNIPIITEEDLLNMLN